MAVVIGDFVLYGGANLPADDTNIVGGAIDLANQITGGAIGELFNKRNANAGGGADSMKIRHVSPLFREPEYKDDNPDPF